MQLAVFSILVGVLSGFAGGGRFANVGWRRIKFVGLPVAGFSAVAASRWITNDVAFYLGIFGLFCLAAFAVANLKALSCMWLVALGLVLNLAVTANNHGMPYSPVALATAGVRPVSYNDIPKSTPMSHPERPGDQLLFLSDVIPLQPMRTVVSFGDILVAVGLGCVTATAMWDRRPRRLRNPRHLKQTGAGPKPDPSIRARGTTADTKRRLPRFGSRPRAVPAGLAPPAPREVIAEAGAKLRDTSGGVLSRLREARESGIGLTPKEVAAQVATQLAVQREETTFKNWLEADGTTEVPIADVPIVPGTFDDLELDDSALATGPGSGDATPAIAEGGAGSLSPVMSDSDPHMAARLRLLHMTGDASALIDLSNGSAKDFEDVAAAHAVAEALRRHALDESLVTRASMQDSEPPLVGENGQL